MMTLVDDQRGASTATYHPGWLDRSSCAAIVEDLRAVEQNFEGGTMLVDGRPVPTPRKVVAFGEDRYAYPDMGESLPWPTSLGELRARAAREAGHSFNYALVNWYRDGHDHTGWHGDKVALHVPGTRIGIVSLGATRTLRFRETGHREACAEVRLEHGSLLWMGGDLQIHYEHAIPPAPEVLEERFSVTLRQVVPA